MRLLRETYVYLIFIVGLTGCAGLAPDTHRAYVGENQSAAEIAIVRAVSAEARQIDGDRLIHPDSNKYYAEIYLPPGAHGITLYRKFAVSALLRLKGYIEVVSEPITVELEAGHIYELHGDRTVGDPDIGVMLWIQDAESGEIVARGHKLKEL